MTKQQTLKVLSNLGYVEFARICADLGVAHI